MQYFSTLRIVFAFCLLCVGSCTVFDEDDNLTLERRPYTGSNLKLDGYYYKALENGYWYGRFINRNGIIREMLSFPANEIEKTEEKFRNAEWLEKSSSGKLLWGVFQIDNNKIVFQSWYPSDGGALPVYVEYGTIINDTTFQIYRTQRVDGSHTKEKNEMFHFRQFSPKPDSVTKYIP